MDVRPLSFSAGNTWWERVKLKYSSDYVHSCADRLSGVLIEFGKKPRLPSAERIKDPTIESARHFFKIINQDYKKTDQKVIDCWKLYHATVLGISVDTYNKSEGFSKFASSPPLERYLAEHNHELIDDNGQLQIRYNGRPQKWDTVYQEFNRLERAVSKQPLEVYLSQHNHVLRTENGRLQIKYKDSYQDWKTLFQELEKSKHLETYLRAHNYDPIVVDGKLQILYDGAHEDWDKVLQKLDNQKRPVQAWNYGEQGVHKKDMYTWDVLPSYKKDDPSKWDKKYIFEFCVTCTDASLRTSGDHSWFRLKDPEGNVYSVGKNLAAKIEKKTMFPFRMKPGFLMAPDVSEYWPQPIYRLPVEISKEAFYGIIDSVNEDKRNESDITFQVFNGNCQEYVNEKASIANIQLPTRQSVVRLITPQFLQEAYKATVPKLHTKVQEVLHAIGAFFINLLSAILGNGLVDSTLKEKKIVVVPHLNTACMLNRDKLQFHPPTYVAQVVFDRIERWRKEEGGDKFGLPDAKTWKSWGFYT